MGVFFSLSRVKKDDSFILQKHDDYIEVDFDIKEKFFVEYIDFLAPCSEVFYSILENQEILDSLNLNEGDFYFFNFAGNFMEGDNVEKFILPEKILPIINILLENSELLYSENIFTDKNAEENMILCQAFLLKAKAEDCYIQFYWQ
jgi:hypothetical protein